MDRVVLSADDDEDAHFLLRRAFSQAGVSAVLKQVNNGEEVLEYLKGHGRFSDRGKFPMPDLLLLDLKMPQISGFEVLEELNRTTEPRKFTVAVFSCSDNPQDVQRATQLGCDAYLVKPSDFKGLVSLVRSIEEDFLKGPLVRSTAPPPNLFKPLARKPAPFVTTQEQPTAKPPPNPADYPEIFHLLVDQVKDYAIFLLDTEGYVRSWNEGARRIKGYESHEIIGKHFSVFYPRQDLEFEKPKFELRVASEMGRYEEEGWRVRKDGSRFWANVVVTPLRDRSGNMTGFAKVTRDLTHRKFQEEQLQRLLESEERFRLLVEQVQDYAIFFLDTKGNISSWNEGAKQIKGYTADEIIGKHFSVFFIPEDLADGKPANELTIAIRDGRCEEEGWRLKKDGSRFWASVVITALWDKRGNLSGFAKVTKDLTVRKREEESLRAKTRELESFAHTLSHDLRAPIRSIASFAQLLMDASAQLSPSEQQEYIQKIYKSAQSMEALVRDILKLSEVTLAPVVSDTVNIADILREATEFLSAQIDSSAAKIKVRKPLPAVHANRTLLLQIFTNLIANALKFSRPGLPPEIEIHGEMKENSCNIHVKDQGIGIPREMHESIFEMFNRGGAGNASQGSGIGLAIVRRAVERVGGSVSVKSTPSEGSEFIVSLPCAGAASAAA